MRPRSRYRGGRGGCLKPILDYIIYTNQVGADGAINLSAHAQNRGSASLCVDLQEQILESFEKEPQASERDAGRRFGVDNNLSK